MNIRTEYESHLVCNPQWNIDELLGNCTPPKTNEPKPISNDRDLLYWFVHVYIPPHPKDAEQWETMSAPDRLRWLFDFLGQLKDAQVRDVSDIHPGFQNGLTFQEHFPGKSLDTLLRYEREVRKIRNPARSEPHNAAHIGEVSASKGSTRIQQTPRETLAQRVLDDVGNGCEPGGTGWEDHVVESLNTYANTKDLEDLGQDAPANYTEGLEVLNFLHKVCSG